MTVRREIPWRDRLALWWEIRGRTNTTLLACFVPLPVATAAAILLPRGPAVCIGAGVFAIAVAFLMSGAE